MWIFQVERKDLLKLDIINRSQAEQQYQEMKAQPSKFTPVAYFILSHYLFNTARKREAMKWFYAGQVRARYDSERCADLSTHTLSLLSKKSVAKDVAYE